MVSEPSVFEPLKVYYNYQNFRQSRHCFNIPVTAFTNSAGDQGNHPFATVKALNFVRSGVVIDCDNSLLRRDLRKFDYYIRYK